MPNMPGAHVLLDQFVVVGISSIIQGYVSFSQTGAVIIMDALFAVAFLVLYPWRAARGDK